MERLKLAIPNGSLMEPTLALFRKIGYPMPARVGRDNRLGVIHDVEVEICEREVIASLVRDGVFDCGITGADLRLAEDIVVPDVGIMCALPYSRATLRPVKYVLAGPRGLTREQWETNQQPRRIGAERPTLAWRILAPKMRASDRMVKLTGHEEQAPRRGLCDAVFVMIETGDSIKANDLVIIYDELFISTPELLYRPDIEPNSSQYVVIENIGLALRAVLGGEDRVMVVFDILTKQLPTLHGMIAGVSPTVSRLMDPEWHAGQVLIPRHKCGEVLRLLKANGAQEIAMHSIDGYLP